MSYITPMRFDQWMREAGLTAGQIADALGVHRVTLQGYLSGRDFPRADIIERIRGFTRASVTAEDLRAAWRSYQR
jgi:transcriptional regulator with XRE-family HTH domain